MTHDGIQDASCVDDWLRVWRTVDARVLTRIPLRYFDYFGGRRFLSNPKLAAFSRDSSRVALALDSGIEVWDLSERRNVRSLPPKDATSAMTCSTSGRYLAIAGSAVLLRRTNASVSSAGHVKTRHAGRRRLRRWLRRHESRRRPYDRRESAHAEMGMRISKMSDGMCGRRSTPLSGGENAMLALPSFETYRKSYVSSSAAPTTDHARVVSAGITTW